MLSDERLDYLISIHDEAAEHDASIHAALEELRATRRRDAAIEKALRDKTKRLELYACFVRGAEIPEFQDQIEITLHDVREETTDEVYADTFSEALFALAAGLGGESK